MTEIDFFSLTPYLLLALAIVASLKGGKQKTVAVSTALALVMAFLTQTVQWPGVVFFVAAPLSLFVWVNHYFADRLRQLGFLSFIVCAYFLVTHSVESVNNLKIFDQVVFSEGSAPFDMYLNFDKAYLAVLLLAMLPKFERERPLAGSYFRIFKYYIVAVVLLLPLAYFTGYVRPQLNVSPYILLWALNNLLFVVFSEEVIFRRFIQNYLVDYIKNVQYGDLLAIFIAAVLFGLAHLAGGGLLYAGLATIAGIVYGLCFYHSCNVRTVIILHFLVNLTHILFFTYPYAV